MTPGRNDPCPCGSGEKYKRCCGKPTAGTPSPAAVSGFDASALVGLMQSGRFAELEAETERLLKSQPQSGILWKLHGGARMNLNKDAREAFARACRLIPGDPEVHFCLGMVSQEHGDLATAEAAYRSAVSIKPDFAEAHDGLGSVLLAADKPLDAATSYRMALKLKPGFAEAHGNLGNALMELKQFEDAVFQYRRMLEYQPTVPEAHNNLGNALSRLNRYAEAEKCYRRVVELRPEDPGVHVSLGNALREIGRSHEALEELKLALRLNPEHAQTYRLMGNAQFDLGLLDDAAESYQQALRRDPKSVDTLLALSKLLRQTGRSTQAEEVCRMAMQVDPDCAEAFAIQAEIEADRGRFAESEALLRRAVNLSPDLAEAWASLARYRKMHATDQAWLERVQGILSKPLPVGQEINLRNAVGKYLDDVEQFDAAFDSYRQANELKKRGGVHDRQRVARRADTVIKLYGRDWFAKTRSAGTPSELPVFIVGMPRSGTTLAEQILASHPNAYGAGELRFWHTAALSLETSERTAPDPRSLPKAAQEYLKLLQSLSKGEQRVIDKMPANFLNLGLIHAALPGARIIHMSRNAMDTGLSIYFQTLSATHSYAYDLDDIAHYYRQYQRVMAHWRSVLPEGVLLDVPYEELVEEPESWTRRMLEFIQLPFDAQCLNFHETQRTVTTASNWQVRQRINKASAGRWRHYERHLGPLLELAER